jgi:hypothetical protein
MQSRLVAESIWLTTPEATGFFQLLEKRLDHPTAIHAAYRAQRNADLGISHVAAILSVLKRA